MRLVLATGNAGKVRELQQALGPLGVSVIAMSELGVESVEEVGETFLDNARLKAHHVARATGEWALGEDSGLEVDALDGAPGVYSARFAGEGADDASRIAKLLARLEGIPREQRGAQFRSVMVLAGPDGREWVAEGICRGHIVTAPQGTMGFGYDPVFVPLGHTRTFAQMTVEEKGRLSHRGQALRRLLDVVRRLVSG